MQTEALAAAGERVLAAVLGRAVRLVVVAEPRSGRVLRCRVDGGDVGSVIVKGAEPGEGLRGLATVHNELAALEVLGQSAPGAAPRLLGADPALGVLVMEDLGDGPSLATYLRNGDPVVAARAAVTSAAALGALHASTAGEAGGYEQARAALSPSDLPAHRLLLRGRHAGDAVDALPELVAAHDLPALPTAASAELTAAVDELAAPGPFLALSSGDPCPDNELHTEGDVRFFDFEAAAARHALIDAAYYLLPFPNCWCWRPLPADLAAEMLVAYRTALAAGCSAAADDARWRLGLHRAAAAWLAVTVRRRLPLAGDDELERQRLLVALGALAPLDGGPPPLPALSSWAERAAQVLRRRWPTTPSPGPYPAFGGPPLPVPAG